MNHRDKIKAIGSALGWTDIHGGPEEGGMYWRGMPPGHKGMAKACPQWIHPDMTSSETLRAIFSGCMLKWRQLPMLGDRVVVKVYYPSEDAFMATLSLKKGGEAMTEEGRQIRHEARMMRSVFLAAYPDGRIVFDIEPMGEK